MFVRPLILLDWTLGPPSPFLPLHLLSVRLRTQLTESSCSQMHMCFWRKAGGSILESEWVSKYTEVNLRLA